jgi:amidase
VRDSALLLDISCQPQPGDPYWLAAPTTPFFDEVSHDPGQLRIAFTPGALVWGESEPAPARAARDAARLCETLGHHVEEARPDLDFQEMAADASTVVSANVAVMLEREAMRRGSPIREDELEHVTWAIYQAGLDASVPRVGIALQNLQAFARKLAAFFERYDVFVLPTLAQPPVPVGHINPNDSGITDYLERLYSFMPNTQPFNVGGQPAMSVPLHWSDSLPIGVQFVSKMGAEALLFRLAGQLEAAQPWFDRTPPELADAPR